MNDTLGGIHHVTAIATDPQRNLDFYNGVLGLRLVKKTVNFDDPGTYHFYFGNEEGEPGTILTFFPWPMARRGSRGTGQTTATAFSVPEGSLGFWAERLSSEGVVAEDPKTRFAEEVLTFLDPDGLKLELVAHAEAGERPAWEAGGIAEAHAIRGFHGVTLAERELEPTARLLTETLGYRRVAESGDRTRFEAAGGGPAAIVDVLHQPGEAPGHVAAGTIHHVAFRTPSDAEQGAWLRRLAGEGHHVTPVQDRQYFHSIYFREPGGVLFEIATDPPGFALDESLDALGTGLELPPWLESRRSELEQSLPEVTLATAESRSVTVRLA